MKKIEEFVLKLAQYSQVEQQSIYELLDYIGGTADAQQQKDTEALLSGNKNLAQIVKGLQIYYSLYGRNSQEFMNYLQKARNEGLARIKG